VVDNVDAAGEPDLAVWSLDKCFEQLRFAETVLDRIAGGTPLRSPQQYAREREAGRSEIGGKEQAWGKDRSRASPFIEDQAFSRGRGAKCLSSSQFTFFKGDKKHV
jgi:hypothetical protein